MRFLIAAELCHAFEHFGGFANQLSHLGTVLSLSITEHIGIALAYHRVVGQKLQEKARQRNPGPGPYVELLAEQNFTLLEQAKREYVLSTASPHPKLTPAEKVSKVPGVKKGGKKGKGQDVAGAPPVDTYRPHRAPSPRRRSRSRSPFYYRRQTANTQNQWPAQNRQQPHLQQLQNTQLPKQPHGQGRGQRRR